MISETGTPQVLEFNARLGDPETQPMMMRLESDLAELCMATLSGTLAEQTCQWSEQSSCGVVMAAPGIPMPPPWAVRFSYPLSVALKPRFFMQALPIPMDS